MDENIICPFCNESDFDLIGLKHHLVTGRCEIFNTTISIYQERHLSGQSTRPDKCSDEVHALKRMGGWSICPVCDENISGG